MRCLSPPRQPSSIFYVEKKQTPPCTPASEAGTYSVKWEEFVAHGSSVTCLSLGRKSGRVMATGGEDKKVNLWAVGKSSCIMSLSGHTSPVECVKFGQCEDIVCAGAVSGAIKIWDLEAAKILRTLLGHKSSVRCVDFHPYGDFIASGSSDSSIKLWDKRRKSSIFTYKGHTKSVNALKFSPDGRWIASGSDDGIVKLWDLPAGKVRAELRGHGAPIHDIEFHPNELLLATCSADKSVKFWDLENYRMVSSTDVDPSPIQSIYFSPNGKCLFGGAQDVLKVYSWEPVHTLDTLVMGWGRVSDISSSESQLIVGAFNLTNVSVYIMDLKRVEPGDTEALDNIWWPDEEIEALDGLNRYDIEGTCVPDVDLSQTRVIQVEIPTFLPPLQDSATGAQGDTEPTNVLNCTFKVATVHGKQTLLALPMGIARPYNYNEEVSEVCPVEAEVSQLEAVQFPEVTQNCELEVYRQNRSKSSGIELDDFLPQSLLNSEKGNYSGLEMSDAEAISSIYRGHESVVKVLGHRRIYLQTIMRIWRTESALAGLTSAVRMRDPAILVDILTLLVTKPSCWTLDICQLLLPIICDLMKSKYETYLSIGCMSLKLILKNFAQVIRFNLASPRGIGIDISREERHRKCKICFNYLMSLKSLVLQKKEADGQIGKLFSELYTLLQAFDT